MGKSFGRSELDAARRECRDGIERDTLRNDGELPYSHKLDFEGILVRCSVAAHLPSLTPKTYETSLLDLSVGHID